MNREFKIRIGMKKIFIIFLFAFTLCGCESQEVREGRKTCEYALSRMYFEHSIMNEHITREGENVVFNLIIEVREKGGEPLKSKIHKIVTNGSELISIDK